MKFYQDTTLLPDSDITLGFLWQKVYQQVHIALVEQKEHPLYCSIGIGFPAYGSRGFQWVINYDFSLRIESN